MLVRGKAIKVCMRENVMVTIKGLQFSSKMYNDIFGQNIYSVLPPPQKLLKREIALKKGIYLKHLGMFHQVCKKKQKVVKVVP